jgi:hypothetical protein
VSLRFRGKSKPCLDAGGKSAEVADSSNFVIGELDAKVVFKASEKFKGLQAVDSQFLKEIIVGLKFGARNFELRRSEIQNLIGCLFEVFHFYPHSTIGEGLADFFGSSYHINRFVAVFSARELSHDDAPSARSMPARGNAPGTCLIGSETQGVALGFIAVVLSAPESKLSKSEFTSLEGWPSVRRLLANFLQQFSSA